MTYGMPACHETRDLLEEYRRGELAPEAARSVEMHLAQCAACRRLREGDDALAAMVQQLPRTPAPSTLRRALQQELGLPRGLARWLKRPWVAAVASAVVVALALSPWVRFRTDDPTDTLEQLLRSGVAEHRRILLQLEAAPAEVGDPMLLFDRVRSLTEVQLSPVFAGIGELRLLAARPTVLAERKAAAAALRYPTSPVTTYFVLLGKDLPMPSERRVQIEQYRPYMRQLNGFRVIYWKQGDLAYFMVSGLDDHHSRQLFLKMRKAL